VEGLAVGFVTGLLFGIQSRMLGFGSSMEVGKLLYKTARDETKERMVKDV